MAGRAESEAAFRRALELSEKDGSIVLSAGSMFVSAEVMTAWDKIINVNPRNLYCLHRAQSQVSLSKY